MARMTWLADVLRAAGLPVLEYPNWKVRGRDGMRPKVVIAHHTATHWTTSDGVVTNLLVNGRSDLPGPLCHLGLNRKGQFIVIAAGKANHAGAGVWRDANESVEAIGIEAYNYGNSVAFPTREEWPSVQLDAYDRGVAALLKHIGRDASHVCAHREWAQPIGRKPDPSGIDMNEMRRRVALLLQGDDMPFTPQEEAALKALAPYSTFLSLMSKSLLDKGPTTGSSATPQSLLHVLEVHRLVAADAGVSGAAHQEIKAHLLGQ